MAAAGQKHPHTRQGMTGAQTGAGGLGHLEDSPSAPDVRPSQPLKGGEAARRPAKGEPRKAEDSRKH